MMNLCPPFETRSHFWIYKPLYLHLSSSSSKPHSWLLNFITFLFQLNTTINCSIATLNPSPLMEEKIFQKYSKEITLSLTYNHQPQTFKCPWHVRHWFCDIDTYVLLLLANLDQNVIWGPIDLGPQMAGWRLNVLYIFDILTSNRGLSDTETLYYYNNFYEERNPIWSCVL